MAQYKIQRAKGVEGSTIYTYTAPGHNECVPPVCMIPPTWTAAR